MKSPFAALMKSRFWAAAILSRTACAGCDLSNGCMPLMMVKYSMLTLRSGQAAATPFLVTSSIWSTSCEVKNAACIDSCNCGSGRAGGGYTDPGGPAGGGEEADACGGAENAPSLPKLAAESPPAGAHGVANMLGTTGEPD